MKRRFVLSAVLAATLVTGTALAACGGDDDDADGDATQPASTQPAAATEPSEQATEPAEGATEPAGDATEPASNGIDNLTVTASDFSFAADISTVAPGAVVMVNFSNTGSAPHTLTFYTDAEYSDPIPGGNSEQVSAGGSINFTFEAPESGSAVYYRCEVHPDQMEGELAIE